MPIYEFKCSSCGSRFEILTGMDNTVTCQSCGSENVVKQFSSFAVHAGSAGNVPECSPACGDGFQKGTCGSGMCCGGH